MIGVVHRPNADRKERKTRPGVILYHGFTGTKVEPHRLFVKMAERLSDMGIVALRFDFRGSGDSEGNFEDMTFGGEVSDALRSCEYMLEHESVDPERLGVIGLSLGGAVAACVTGRYAKLRSTALWSAVADLDFFNRIADELGEIESYDRGGNIVGRGFIDGLAGYTPYNEVVAPKSPVLVLHGDADASVPVEHAYKYVESLKKANSPHRLHIVEGADHTFNSHPWETEVIEATAAWFRETLLDG